MLSLSVRSRSTWFFVLTLLSVLLLVLVLGSVSRVRLDGG